MRTDGCSTFAPKTVPWKVITGTQRKDAVARYIKQRQESRLRHAAEMEKQAANRGKAEKKSPTRVRTIEQEKHRAVMMEQDKARREAYLQEHAFQSPIFIAIMKFHDMLVQDPKWSMLRSLKPLTQAITNKEVRRVNYTFREVLADFYHFCKKDDPMFDKVHKIFNADRKQP